MKRKVFIFVLAVFFIEAAAYCDWPQFLGPHLNNTAKEANLPGKWPAGGPKVLWSVGLGLGYGGAAIEGSKVYVLDRAGDLQDVVRCLNLKSGLEEWKFSYEAAGKADHPGSRSVPSVDGENVYTIGQFGQIYCVSKKTHQALWHRNILMEFGGKRPNWAVAQSPLRYKDLVIAAPTSAQAGAVAFKANTGEIAWKSPAFAGAMSYASPVLCNLLGEEQVLVVTTEGVDGVDANNGSLLWSYGWACKIPVPSALYVSDGQVFITGGYRAGSAMFRVVKEQGKYKTHEVFRTNDFESHIHQPLLINGHLYALGNSNEQNFGFECMDLNGRLLWKTVNRPHFDKGGYIYAGGMIYIMDGGTGELCMVKPDPTGYREVARAKMLAAKPIWAPMAYSDGLLVIRDQKTMKCVDLKNP